MQNGWQRRSCCHIEIHSLLCGTNTTRREESTCRARCPSRSIQTVRGDPILDSSEASLSVSTIWPTRLVSKCKPSRFSDAVIHESLRIHGNLGLIIERLVPPEGVVLDGYKIPGGTVVGINAWVIHRNRDIFGEDVDTFRPERWLEGSEDTVSEMRKNIFSVSRSPPLHERLSHLPTKHRNSSAPALVCVWEGTWQ